MAGVQRLRRLRRGCLISLGTLVALLVLAEIGLRVADYRGRRMAGSGAQDVPERWVSLCRAGIFEEIDDPVRRYAMAPGADFTLEGWRFRVNAQRARGAPLPTDKPAGEKRILCLGDSFAFGLWCGEDETLVAQLARLANEAEERAGSATRWRAIDLGVPGYTTEQQLRSLEQDGLALEPDVVVLYFNTNDITSEGFFFSDEYGRVYSDHLPLPVGLRRFLWRHCELYFALTQRLTDFYVQRESPPPQLDPDVPWAHVREDNKRRTAAAMAAIAERCRAAGAELFVVNQPLMTYSWDLRSPDWPFLPLVRWASEQIRQLGVPGIDLLGWARGYDDGVDRLEQGVDPDFRVDRYFADPRLQELYRHWEQTGELLRDPATISQPDFHLLAPGYAHIAHLCYERMRAAGLLP